jgi:DNA-binding NtrC family response regulator
MLAEEPSNPVAVHNKLPVKPRILLVDDTESVLESLKMILEHHDFEVVTASHVNDALQLIGSQTFDVLLSDLHMPNPGDGLTVVSAMRHSNPKAVTIIFSGYPEMKEAAAAILMQADEILVKPLEPKTLVEIIRARLKRARTPERIVENVANILEREAQATIQDWLLRVDLEPEIITVPLDFETRCATHFRWARAR